MWQLLIQMIKMRCCKLLHYFSGYILFIRIGILPEIAPEFFQFNHNFSTLPRNSTQTSSLNATFHITEQMQQLGILSMDFISLCHNKLCSQNKQPVHLFCCNCLSLLFYIYLFIYILDLSTVPDHLFFSCINRGG